MQLTPPTEIGSAVECAAAATATYGGRYASMDGGGRATQEQLPRAMQDDSMNGIGRVASGAKPRNCQEANLKKRRCISSAKF